MALQLSPTCFTNHISNGTLPINCY